MGFDLLKYHLIMFMAVKIKFYITKLYYEIYQLEISNE